MFVINIFDTQLSDIVGTRFIDLVLLFCYYPINLVGDRNLLR